MFKSEYQQWLGHEATRELLNYLQSSITEYQLQWLNGVFTAETSEGTAQKNAHALGSVKALNDICQVVEDGTFGNLSVVENIDD